MYMQFHGWPDLSIGWRNQIPMLLDMGFLVVAPDMMGYGQTVSQPRKLIDPMALFLSLVRKPLMYHRSLSPSTVSEGSRTTSKS